MEADLCTRDLWLGILIYLEIYRKIRIQDHWKFPNLKEEGSADSIVRYMTYNRFFLLLRYIRIFEPSNEGINNNTTYNRIWGRVDEWSDYMQKATTDLVMLGTNCAIDECMIRNKGRCKGTTIVKGKPIPRGFKVWAVAQLGLLLRWIWHIPKQPWGHNKARKEEKPIVRVNPTQAVVVFLMKSLPSLFIMSFLITFSLHPGFFAGFERKGSSNRDGEAEQRLLSALCCS